ncbi:hypothetical protein LJY25_10675 [Hymenobacter sp. BT175]|uniref:hypothetical protein n=1 Tax=Hymenobacter translucens TaxID=2886507 RepID=UPI001D0EC3A4|nr:hypothetical protein [Hymenobacter translucens]MCC2546909.1 hypothetical protein [Hymenobacter translucens]
MRTLILFLLCLIGALLSCQPDADLLAPADLTGRTWLESHEERPAGSDVQVYRPDTYAFPPSWPRQGFRFDDGGVLTAYGASPADAPETYPGRWEQEGAGTYRLTYTMRGQVVSYRLELISLANDVLKARRLP